MTASLSYEIIIGLEVHVQLRTRSKLFCRCTTQFGAPPNTQTCPVCIGMPGSLPVMNRTAYQLALRTAVALNCEIPEFTKWDRKQYYYPDLPKGYQISQFDLPMSQNGWLEIADANGEFPETRVGIIRAHLEEDAGKSMHDEVAGKADSRIDLNRTGTPLLEIVSEPDLRSPAMAKTYLNELKLLLTYLDVSDCNMQEGSLRVDANINLRIDNAGTDRFTPIVEVKNMNSFRAVERALAYEAKRQYEVWQETEVDKDGPGGHKTTRGWDESSEITRPQRQKEESSDYRYFPDPDLMPVVVNQVEIQQVRDELGELPAALRDRLQNEFSIDHYDSDVLVNQGRAFTDYFIRLAESIEDGRLASNWMQQQVLRYLNEREADITEFPVSDEQLAELLRMIQKRDLDTSRGKDVLAEMIQSKCSVQEAIEKLGIEQVDDQAVQLLCQQLIEANPKIVEDVKSGNQKAIGALIGQAKRQNPNVNPNDIRQICLARIQEL